VLFGLFRANKNVPVCQLGGIIKGVGFRSTAARSATLEATAMKGKTKEVWKVLCEQAAVEEDPEKLVQLAEEIDRMLAEKEKRLVRNRTQVNPNTGQASHF
jgi:hypothetical protein